MVQPAVSRVSRVVARALRLRRRLGLGRALAVGEVVAERPRPVTPRSARPAQGR